MSSKKIYFALGDSMACKHIMVHVNANTEIQYIYFRRIVGVTLHDTYQKISIRKSTDGADGLIINSDLF